LTIKNGFTSTIAGASIVITILSLMGRGLGFFREIIFAAFFGLSSNFEIYLISAVLPISINTITLYLGQNYFIPVYSSLAHSGEEAKNKYLSHSLALFFAGGLLILLVLFVFAKPIISSYLGNVDNNILNSALRIYMIFIFTIPLNCIISIISAYLQAEKDFFSPAFSQLILNIMLIILIPVFSKSLAVYVIPLGYLGGTVLQLLYLIFRFDIKSKFSLEGILNKYTGAFGSLLLTILIIEGVSQLYIMADRFFLQYVEKGGIAALNYGLTVYYLPIAIFSGALSTAVFPSFSKAFKSDEKNDIESRINKSIMINSFLFVPITFIFVFYGDYIIRLLFQRGRFISADTLITFQILKIYSCSLIFYSSYSLLNKILYSAKSLQALLVITVIGAIIKILLNILLVKSYQQNGLALSSAVSYSFLFVASAFYIYKYLNVKSILKFIPYTVFYLLNAFVCYLSIQILVNAFNFAPNIKSIIALLLFPVLFYLTLIFLKDHSAKLLNNVFQSFYHKGNEIIDVKADNI
jgi:putative peptidoglycan lipid II flippase